MRIHGDDHRAKDRNRDGEIPVTFGGASGQTKTGSLMIPTVDFLQYL